MLHLGQYVPVLRYDSLSIYSVHADLQGQGYNPLKWHQNDFLTLYPKLSSLNILEEITCRSTVGKGESTS